MTTYYVDARNGSDSNNGESTGKAWKSINQVNRADLDPGDKVLFRAGDVYTQTLDPSSSGSSSSLITFGRYGSGDNPVFNGRGDLSYGIQLERTNYVRFENLEVTNSNQGVYIYNSRGVQLSGLEVHDNERNGIHLKSSHDVRIERGSSHDNGVDGGTNLGHGVLMSNGSSGNLVSGMRLYNNAEDGVQFSPDSGSSNRLVGNEMWGNKEDGVDIKNGNNTLTGNYIYGNAVNAVFVHKNSGGDTTTLIDNHLKGAKGHALDITASARGVSRDNVYEDGNSRAVRVTDGARVSHDGDRIIDFGSYKGSVEFSLAGSTSSTSTMSLSASIEGDSVELSRMSMPTTELAVGEETVPERIAGTEHDDVLEGGNGADEILGKEGDDLLRAGLGDDVLRGGVGEDRLRGEEGDDALLGGKDADRLFGGEGDDALRGDGGADVLAGEAGHDVLNGGNGDDVLSGGDGSDLLHGGRGHDELYGGTGDDILIGGQGNDRLEGGEGADLFVVTPGSGSDTIVDFDLRSDSIDLSGWDSVTEDRMVSGARQAGSDVTMDLEGGGRLTIANLDLADLAAAVASSSTRDDDTPADRAGDVADIADPGGDQVLDSLAA